MPIFGMQPASGDLSNNIEITREMPPGGAPARRRRRRSPRRPTGARIACQTSRATQQALARASVGKSPKTRQRAEIGSHPTASSARGAVGSQAGGPFAYRREKQGRGVLEVAGGRGGSGKGRNGLYDAGAMGAGPPEGTPDFGSAMLSWVRRQIPVSTTLEHIGPMPATSRLGLAVPEFNLDGIEALVDHEPRPFLLQTRPPSQ